MIHPSALKLGGSDLIDGPACDEISVHLWACTVTAGNAPTRAGSVHWVYICVVDAAPRVANAAAPSRRRAFGGGTGADATFFTIFSPDRPKP